MAEDNQPNIRQQLTMKDIYRRSSTHMHQRRRSSLGLHRGSSSLLDTSLHPRRSSLLDESVSFRKSSLTFGKKQSNIDIDDAQLIREVAAANVDHLEDELEHIDDPPATRSEFHQAMDKFANLKAFSGLILSVILLNTAILIAMTWQDVNVRLGKCRGRGGGGGNKIGKSRV